GAGGPPNVVAGVANPTIESAQELMKDRGVRLVVVTGGPDVVRQAMLSGKRAICAGPGNPPVVVDETADIDKAARDIILGGSTAPDSVRMVVVEVNEDHPLLWSEQMMPVMPVCRVPNANRAIDLAVEVEGGNRHTAIMHSKNLDNLSRMAKACDCSIFVKNGRSQAGLGLEGEGYCSFTIASPTGEGMTGPRSFSRYRRCTLVDHFRIT